MKYFPKVKIETTDLIDSFADVSGKTFSAVKLIEAAKKYPVFEMPLAGIDLSHLGFEIDNMDDFIFHVKRTRDTDLKYPIILDHYGRIVDGWHRVCKSIVMGKTTIKAVRLEVNPVPDSVKEG